MTENTQDTATKDEEREQNNATPAEPPQPEQPDSAREDDAVEGEAPEGDGNANKEAAKYRRRLREAEAERDTLQERLSNLQRQSAEQIAREIIAKPASMWKAVSLDDALNDDGTVSADKVRELARQAMTEIGLEGNPRIRGNIVPNVGNNPSPYSSATFWNAFAPRQ